MAYGTTDGVKDKIKNYTNITDFDALLLARRRTQADAYINTKISAVVTLPLPTVPDAINEISDMLTAYWMLQRIFLDQELEGRSSYGDLKKEADDWLDMILKNPTGVFGLAESAIIATSTTMDDDRKFSNAQYQDGKEVSDEYSRTMDDNW